MTIVAVLYLTILYLLMGAVVAWVAKKLAEERDRETEAFLFVGSRNARLVIWFVWPLWAVWSILIGVCWLLYVLVRWALRRANRAINVVVGEPDLSNTPRR